MRTTRGYALLLVVLVVGAASVTIATTLLLLGADALRTASIKELSAKARALAHGCAEEGLEQIRESSNFSGYGTLTIEGNACGYDVVNLGGQNRRVNASSTVGSVVRKVRVEVGGINPTISVSSWQEVVD